MNIDEKKTRRAAWKTDYQELLGQNLAGKCQRKVGRVEVVPA
jgi:hypothetical protein